MNWVFDCVLIIGSFVGLCWSIHQIVTGVRQWHKLKKGQIALALKLKEMGAEI